MPERYSELRAQAVNVNNTTREINECIPGRGECCKATVPMTQGDVDLLNEAIAQNKIPQNVLDYAKARASDSDNDRCPFLSKTNKCLIYSLKIKPLMCEIWGLPAKPLTATTAVNVASGVVEKGYPSHAVRRFTCVGCSIIHGLSIKFITREIANTAAYAKDYVERNQVTTTHEFVLEHLASQGDPLEHD